MQDRKTAEAGKKPPRAYRGRNFFFVIWKRNLSVGEKKSWLQKKRNGSIRRCHAQDLGFGSRSDQYLNDVGPLVEPVTSVAVTPRVPGTNTEGTST